MVDPSQDDGLCTSIKMENYLSPKTCIIGIVHKTVRYFKINIEVPLIFRASSVETEKIANRKSPVTSEVVSLEVLFEVES